MEANLVNIKIASSFVPYHFYTTACSDGIEYRHCFSAILNDEHGFAVWLERADAFPVVRQQEQFVECRKSAQLLAENQCLAFRKLFPFCTYHQVIMERGAFAGSAMAQDHRSLRQWTLAQGIPGYDFAITPYGTHRTLSFRSMDTKVENAILSLRLAGVLSRHQCGNLVIEIDGCLDYLKGYRE